MRPTPERRGGARAPFGAEVDLELSPHQLRAEARDLSVRGLGLALPGPHPVAGSPLVTEFALPEMRVPLRLHARVAWSDPAHERLGLVFAHLPSELAELLARFVEERGAP